MESQAREKNPIVDGRLREQPRITRWGSEKSHGWERPTASHTSIGIKPIPRFRLCSVLTIGNSTCPQAHLPTACGRRAPQPAVALPTVGSVRAWRQLVEDAAAVLLGLLRVALSSLRRRPSTCRREHRLRTVTDHLQSLYTDVHTCRHDRPDQRGRGHHPWASSPKSAELKADPAPALQAWQRQRGRQLPK